MSTLKAWTRPHVVLLLAVLGVVLLVSTIGLAISNSLAASRWQEAEATLRAEIATWQKQYLAERDFVEASSITEEQLRKDLELLSKGDQASNEQVRALMDRWRQSESLNEALLADLREADIKINQLMTSSGKTTETVFLDCAEAGKIPAHVTADNDMIETRTADDVVHIKGSTRVGVWDTSETNLLLSATVPWTDSVFITVDDETPATLVPSRKVHVRFGLGMTQDGGILGASISRDFHARLIPWSTKRTQLSTEVVLFGNQDTGGALVLFGN